MAIDALKRNEQSMVCIIDLVELDRLKARLGWSVIDQNDQTFKNIFFGQALPLLRFRLNKFFQKFRQQVAIRAEGDGQLPGVGKQPPAVNKPAVNQQVENPSSLLG
jgi:hypothetical protein